MSEPVAASLAYGLEKNQTANTRVVVFDLGGGTLDVSGHITDGNFKVLSTSGDTHLGGTDMDSALVDYILGEFKKQSGLDVRNDDREKRMRIRERRENAKIQLSSLITTEINLEFLGIDPIKGPQSLVISLTRAELEEIILPIIERIPRLPLLQALEDANISPATKSTNY